MKSKVMLGIVFALMAGCSSQTDDAQPKNDEAVEQNEASNAKEMSKQETEQAVLTPQEPAAADKCAFCEMKIYQKNEDMGAYTAQMVTADGEHLFFDDSGCLLNTARQQEEQPQVSWVRDHDTLEWIPMETAAAVKAELKTPMKYETAFFASTESAETFISENPDKNGALIDISVLDTEAEKRMKKKMEMMKENEESHEGHMHE